MSTKIEELRAAYEEARKAADKAVKMSRMAKQALDDELSAEKLREFEAMGGVVGVTRVRTPDLWRDISKPNMRSGPYLVTGATVGHMSAVFTIAKIKKDGTASAAPVGDKPRRVFILAEDQPKGGDA